MKTELEIAKLLLKGWKMTKPHDGDLWRLNIYYNNSLEHRATCQRWLEFLINEIHGYIEEVRIKIKDLKQAIALYEKEGI